jgi:hypothetical protein
MVHATVRRGENDTFTVTFGEVTPLNNKKAAPAAGVASMKTSQISSATSAAPALSSNATLSASETVKKEATGKLVAAKQQSNEAWRIVAEERAKVKSGMSSNDTKVKEVLQIALNKKSELEGAEKAAQALGIQFNTLKKKKHKESKKGGRRTHRSRTHRKRTRSRK